MFVIKLNVKNIDDVKILTDGANGIVEQNGKEITITVNYDITVSDYLEDAKAVLPTGNKVCMFDFITGCGASIVSIEK